MIVGVIVAGIALGSAVVVLMAFGLGSLLALFLPLSPFEASLLSVVAVVGVLAAAWRIIEHIARFNVYRPRWADDEEDAEEDDDDLEDFDEVDEESARRRPPVVHVASSTKIGRNASCPCGSGRKYKRCCGSTQNSQQQNPRPTTRCTGEGEAR